MMMRLGPDSPRMLLLRSPRYPGGRQRTEFDFVGQSSSGTPLHQIHRGHLTLHIHRTRHLHQLHRQHFTHEIHQATPLHQRLSKVQRWDVWRLGTAMMVVERSASKGPRRKARVERRSYNNSLLWRIKTHRSKLASWGTNLIKMSRTWKKNAARYTPFGWFRMVPGCRFHVRAWG